MIRENYGQIRKKSNQIRENFGFEGTPIRMLVREKGEKNK